MEITLPIILQLLQIAGILVGIVYYITIMRTKQRNQEPRRALTSSSLSSEK